jgi:hypothetical protein
LSNFRKSVFAREERFIAKIVHTLSWGSSKVKEHFMHYVALFVVVTIAVWAGLTLYKFVRL